MAMLQTNSKNPWTSKATFIAAKKKVPTAYTPDSYRIFDYKISDTCVPKIKSRSATSLPEVQNDNGYFGAYASLKGQPGYIKNHPREATRRNCPHPQSARFLRSNVLKLNEPIPFIATDSTVSDQNSWFQHTRDDDSSHHKDVATTLEQSRNRRPKKTQIPNRSYTLPRITRSKAPNNNPWILNNQAAEAGLKRTVEHISYQHQYNSRLNPNEPRRGKLHGSFVWTAPIPSLKDGRKFSTGDAVARS